MAVQLARQVNPRPPVAPYQVGGIDVSDGPTDLHSLPNQIACGSEDPSIDRLIRFVIGQQQAQRITGDGVRSNRAEVVGLPRPG
jgi:hypothetical protein